MKDAGADHFADVTGALLLGGASRRMGRDKAWLEIEGEPAAVVLARRLGGFCGELLLVGGEAPAAAPGRRVPDPPGPSSALRGLLGALRAASGSRLLVVATDYYGFGLPLGLALLAFPEAEAVVPRWAGQIHPLCALYQREAARTAAEAAFARGELALRAVLEALSVRWIEGADLLPFAEGGRALANVNSPEELQSFRSGVGD